MNMDSLLLVIACVIVALLAVIWLMWREIDAVRLHARKQEERADGAAGDAALWKVRFEDEQARYWAAQAAADQLVSTLRTHVRTGHEVQELLQAEILDDRRAHDALVSQLRDEIERQHELRDAQTDRVGSWIWAALRWEARARANAANCEKRLEGLRRLLNLLPRPSESVQREIDRLLAP